MKKNREENYHIQKQRQSELRDLEQFYSENKVDNMLTKIEAKKKEITQEIIEYAQTCKVPCKWNDEGDPIAWKMKVHPLVITNYFFKPITPIASVEPIYNAEKLSLVFDYYCDILAEVNDKIGDFPSSLTSFCKLAGITSATLRNYKNSDDLNMRIVAEKIYDQIGDVNITMSQMGIVRERSTIFKMKSQNEMVEKVQPNVNVNIIEPLDMESIQSRIAGYKRFATKKEKK